MTMIFCRGCGKEIHETAPTCPHCGAMQAASISQSNKWMAITAIVLGAVTLLASFSLHDGSQHSTDEVAGVFVFAIPSIVLAAISLSQHRWGKPWSITAIVLAVFSILIAAGA